MNMFPYISLVYDSMRVVYMVMTASCRPGGLKIDFDEMYLQTTLDFVLSLFMFLRTGVGSTNGVGASLFLW